MTSFTLLSSRCTMLFLSPGGKQRVRRSLWQEASTLRRRQRHAVV